MTRMRVHPRARFRHPTFTLTSHACLRARVRMHAIVPCLRRETTNEPWTCFLFVFSVHCLASRVCVLWPTEVRLLLRPGNAPLPADNKFQTIRSFEEL